MRRAPQPADILPPQLARPLARPALTVISLGWGVQSFTLAAMVALGELPPVDAAIHADTTHERAATYAFKAQWQPWLETHGVRVVTVQAPPDILTQVGQLVPAFTLVPDGGASAGLRVGRVRRQCTGDWKIDPMRRWIREELTRRELPVHPGICEQWIGISYDEFHRARTSEVQYISHRYPLLERHMTRAVCIAWLQAHDLAVPGKSACTFCPLQTAASWREQKQRGGADWAHSTTADARMRGARPPHPVFMHRACVALADAVTVPEDQGLVQGGLFDRPEAEDAPCDNGGCFL